MIRLIAAALMLLTMAFPAHAQEEVASPALQHRAAELARLLDSETGEQALFAPSFLAQIPPAQIKAIAARLKAQHGAVKGVARIVPESATAGRIEIDYARSVVSITIALEPEEPHRLIGLLVTGAIVRDDSFEKLLGDVRALHGTAALSVRALGERPATLAAWRAGEPMATGSSFKLYLLAELARAAKAGERRWSDVVPLGPPSLPSGISQAWPARAPATLDTLATLAISISDNTAADTLLHALGRDKVDAIVAVSGHAAPERAIPLLSTVEAFALKMPANAALRANWMAGSPAQRRLLLLGSASRLSRAAIDPTQLAGPPLHIDEVEWFASADDMASLLDWLRREGGAQALAILGINPGIAPGDAARWRYVGYKGGSETGVMAMNYLVEARDGRTWYAVTGSWNDPAAPVDEARFAALMSRALNLLAK